MRNLMVLALLAAACGSPTAPRTDVYEGVTEAGRHTVVTNIGWRAIKRCEVNGVAREWRTGTWDAPAGPYCLRYHHLVPRPDGTNQSTYSLAIEQAPVGSTYTVVLGPAARFY